MSGDRAHSLVAAVSTNQQSWRRPVLISSALAGLYYAYNEGVRMYAYMRLGAAATEQLFMQKLEGTVELEMRLRSFSSVGELRGLLTPVSSKPRTAGPMNHRAFTLIHYPDIADEKQAENISKRTKARHEAMRAAELPPIATMRQISLWAPWHLSALMFGPSEIHLYCRKSRCKTEYFSLPPGETSRIWGGASGLE